MIVIGEKEMESKEVAVRKQAFGDLGSQPIEAFIETILKEVESE